jgi:hypothetical protein
MARTGKADGSAKPVTIYLVPPYDEALKETAWQDRTSASSWAAHVVMSALDKRQKGEAKKEADPQLEIDTTKKTKKVTK